MFPSLALYVFAVKKLRSKSAKVLSPGTAKGLIPGKFQNPKSSLLCRGLPMAFMSSPLKNCVVNPQKNLKLYEPRKLPKDDLIVMSPSTSHNISASFLNCGFTEQF
jgi:hypothetical protein